MTKRFRVHGRCALGETVELSPTDVHHLTVVLRAARGKRVVVVDEDRQHFEAVVDATEPLTVRIESLLQRPDADPEVALEVWLPLLKGGRTDPVIRQLTELGVTRCVVFEGDHGVVRLNEGKRVKRLERLTTIANEATKQCGRYSAPEVLLVAKLDAIEEGSGVVLHPEASSTIRDVLGSRAAAARLVIGPEGGLSARELDVLRCAGLTSGSLGPRVLRAETAVVVAATLALHTMGEGGY